MIALAQIADVNVPGCASDDQTCVIDVFERFMVPQGTKEKLGLHPRIYVGQ